MGYLYYKQDDRALPYISSDCMLPYTVTTHGIPLFVFLRNDFWNGKISPFIDFKIGNNFLITKESITAYTSYGEIRYFDWGEFRLKNGLYLAANVGVAFDVSQKCTLNISVGYQLLSRPYDITIFNYIFPDYVNIDAEYMKMGYTVEDHQFLLNIGVSF